MKLTAERLRELLAYDSLTGEFTWKVRGKGRRAKAGCVCKVSGYVSISIDYESHYAHRLAWLYVTGGWPKDQIDHRNGVRSDNAFANLREADARQNNVNRLARGCYWDQSRQKWVVTMSVRDRTRLVGRFDSEEAARRAYLDASANLHGAEWTARKEAALA